MLKETHIGNSSSGGFANVKYDDTGLQNLLAGIKENYVVRVGILGDKSQRSKSKSSKSSNDMTNADVGLAHEKGIKSRNLPRRSWLLMPLEDHIGEYFIKLGPVAIKDMIVKQGQQAYNELGIACMQIIAKAFDTGGYGKWAPLKLKTLLSKHKTIAELNDPINNDQILVRTGQLKSAVAFKVVAK